MICTLCQFLCSEQENKQDICYTTEVNSNREVEIKKKILNLGVKIPMGKKISLISPTSKQKKCKGQKSKGSKIHTTNDNEKLPPSSTKS